MKNVILIGCDELNAGKAFKRLEQDGDIFIKAWLGIKKGQGLISHEYGEFEKWQEDFEYKICDEIIYTKVYDKLYVFLDMYSRLGKQTISEMVHLFNAYIYFFSELYTKEKIDMVIAAGVPHFGFDALAIWVAEAMGINIIMTLENNNIHLRKKFWAISNLNDIGIFKSIPNNKQEKISLSQKHRENYASPNKVRKVMRKPSQGEFIFSIVSRIIKRIFMHGFGKDVKYRFRKIMIGICKRYIESLEEKIYTRNMLYYQSEQVDFDKNYVYFALHLQPEMTTSAFGGKYCDQLLALEKLSMMLPVDWKIYVKENPVQTAYMRGDQFFARLGKIPKIVLVPSTTESNKLIKNAKFVSTITGSTGWEAVTNGKVALIFGLAWYRKMPGVFEYKEGISLNKILSYDISKIEVEKYYSNLVGLAYDGTLEPGVRFYLDDYNDDENNEMLYQSFKKILNDTQPVGD